MPLDLAEFVSDYLAVAPGASNKEIAEAYVEQLKSNTPITDDGFDTVVKNTLSDVAYYTGRDE